MTKSQHGEDENQRASRPGLASPGRCSPRRVSLDGASGQRRLEGWLLRQQLKESLTLPVLGVLILALFGGSRLAETRDLEGVAIGLALPVVAMVAATAPLRESDAAVSRGARAAAVATAVVAELAVAPAVLHGWDVLPSWGVVPRPALGAGLLLLALLSVPLEVLVVQRGLNSRFAAWTGLVVALSLFVPRFDASVDALGGILAAGIFAAVVGGGAGLALGVAGRRLAGSRL